MVGGRRYESLEARRPKSQPKSYLLLSSHWAVLDEVWDFQTACTVTTSLDLTLETIPRFLEPILSLLESYIAGILGSLLVDQGEVPDTNFRYVQLQKDETYP